MKKLFLGLAAFACLFTACQQETVSSEEEVAVQINASAVAETRGNIYGGDKASEKGGATNVDYSQYDLRYILEVYNANGELAKDRQYFISAAGYQDAVFNLRLTPNRDYRFVVWADFIEEGADQDADLHYNTDNLRNISAITDSVYDESRDAYYVAQDVHVTNSLNKTLTLTRPFGKLRVVTTDIKELELGTYPETVTVHYTKGQRLNTINAYTGEITGTDLAKSYTYTIAKTDYKGGYDAQETHQTLFVDYILAANDGSEEIFNFDIAVDDNKGNLINAYSFVTDIPVYRNILTTLIGNVLTTGTTFTIEIDEMFENEIVKYPYINTIADLNAAIANGGGSYALNADLELDQPIILGEGVNLTLDLAGKTLTAPLFAESNGQILAGNSDSYVFWVKKGATLTIKGEGNVVAQAAKYSMAVWAQGGTVNIEGGYFANAGEGADLLYVSAAGKLNIYGGEFKACEKQSGVDGTLEKYSAINLKGDNTGSTATVFGGKFFGFNPADNKSENPQVNFVAPTSFVVKEGDYFVVRPFEKADGNINLEENFNGNGETVTAGELSVVGSVCPFFHPEGNVTIENVTIDGKNQVVNGYGVRGIYVDKAGTYNINNVEVRNVTYAINVNTNQAVVLNVTNSVLEGWTSYGTSTTATFTGVSFENGVYATLRPQGPTTLKNCEFEEGFQINLDLLKSDITFEGCTYAGRALVATDLISAPTNVNVTIK